MPLTLNETVRVREVAVNWRDGQLAGGSPHADCSLAEAFQRVCNDEAGGGYELQSWQFHRLMTDHITMNETIIAVFVGPHSI